MTKILIIDDDTELCEMLVEYLSLEAFEIAMEHRGDSGADRALAENFDAVVLDVMLPGMNGFEALKKIRSSSMVPVIMLTAKGHDVDRILGLEMGADDYLPKPFNPRELVARLKAIMRRSDTANQSNELRTEAGDLSVKPASRKAFFKADELTLTSTEYAILEVLIENAGEAVTKETLYERALGRSIEAYDRSIDMHISHIRKKIPGGDELIVTVRGVGYQLITAD
ncbi:MAG: response regulator transcription factor [bacterium]